ncbi:MAG: hypothetical protein ACXWJ6_16205 [Xanthobacteraceae bacterium]
MRYAAIGLLLTCACIATPTLAATAVTSSWEGAATESQKKGPYSTVRGPDRSGRYFISSSGRKDRPLWRYRWAPVLVR